VQVTPFSNLSGRTFWVNRDLDNDTFTIRLSAARGRPAAFGWVVVESDLVETEATDETEAAVETEAVDE
jgi:hypothetical protein